jgi:hypothetical protein
MILGANRLYARTMAERRQSFIAGSGRRRTDRHSHTDFLPTLGHALRDHAV